MTTVPFTTLSQFRAVLENLPKPDAKAVESAKIRDAQLTKPPGALGRLEELVLWYVGWRGVVTPEISAPQVVIFAGNHGVCAQGVSAFPPEVTQQMVQNFENGGAAINQLSKLADARMDVYGLSLDRPTADFTTAAAMTESETVEALIAGWNAVDLSADLFVTGEMGIGNTTSAAAVAMALFGGKAVDWTGRGTGADDAMLAVKVKVVEAGVLRHQETLNDPLEVLRCLGGRELAAMVGAITRARMLRIPVILDGFICTAAAAVMMAVNGEALDHTIAGHVSAESAHTDLLQRIGKQPLLSLGMRLGEGSGAALSIGILRGALACHAGMATFSEAGVSDH